ncbi:phytanoyl-CoA dioxygenase family protein [Burkholderia plantarii]|uniref:phytanoyl-CoA dioxygenase family protein n=1 Tax=Burkholderia plantarii TaxID=41899 RepID=UPI000705D329|nr:phytanoyl-CoA dioxygenase family protein [Burkholderia plantarii]ALK32756.1 Phytanoyl-CoA dioxygenase [Burkholderia plantarii]GLZ22806.1 hypothetical protein Bpla01_63350 [Burkholderia plantarii]
MNPLDGPWQLVKHILVDDREIAAARAYCMSLIDMAARPAALIAYHESDETGQRLVRVERFVEDFSERTGIDLQARCRASAQDLLGRSCKLFKDKINFRHPGSPGFRAHQDAAAGWDRYASEYATVAALIEASRPETGGFEMAGGPSPDHLYPNQNGQLDDGLFASLQPRPLHVDAGDGLLFDGRAPHRTCANLSPYVIAHLFLTFNGAHEGDFRERYYSDKIAGMTSQGDGFAFRLFDFGRQGAMQ